MVITHFGTPYIKDGDRVINFYTKEIQTIPTSTEEKNVGGSYEV
jgi:hypothetical protein